MTESELREKIGIGPTELINTTVGAVDIFGVENDRVSYGMLASGGTREETVEEFLAHFQEGRCGGCNHADKGCTPCCT